MKEKNLLGFHIRVDDQALNQLFDHLLDSNLEDIELEVNGIEVHLQRIRKGGNIKIDGTRLNIQLPLAIQVRRQSGLFSVEGAGEILLHLISDIKFGPAGALQLHSFINDHSWLEKPKLQLGALNMSVSTLVTLLIDHSGSIITGKLDEAIRSNFRLAEFLNALITEHLSKVRLADSQGLKIKPVISGINLVPVAVLDGFNTLSGMCQADIHFIRNPEKIPSSESHVTWVDALPMDYQFGVNAEFPYRYLASIFENTIDEIDVGGKKVAISSMDLYYDGHLKADIRLTSPVSARISISGEPVYRSASGVLDIENIKVASNFENFIYKTISGIVNKSIKSGIESKLPLYGNDLLQSGLGKLFNKINQDYAFLHAGIDRVYVEGLDFLSDHILAHLYLERAVLTLTISGEEVKEFIPSK